MSSYFGQEPHAYASGGDGNGIFLGTSESLLQVVVVFAGGGHATFYEGGFISPVPPMRLPRGCMTIQASLIQIVFVRGTFDQRAPVCRARKPSHGSKTSA